MKPDEGLLSALGEVAKREGHGEAPAGADARGRARVLAEIGKPRRPPGRVLAYAVSAVVIAAGLALGLVGKPPIAFTVDGAPAAADVYVHGRADRGGSTVRFAEGSEITFAPGAGGRIAEVGNLGARVLLETGEASFSITHRPEAGWSVEAGPYKIAVIGTTFEASWSVEAQALDVRLHAGEVSVIGPAAPQGFHLHAGQELKAAGGEIRIGQISEAAAPVATAEIEAAGAPPATPDAPSAAPSLAPPARSASARAAAAPFDWPKRVAAGDFRGVVAGAEARGVEAVLGGAALPDLAALADAARYAGRTDLARRALMAERSRFPGAPEARAAAFLLGRIADDAGGTPAEAVRWYDVYLGESPGGAFAAEALGRKLAALHRAADPAAREAAAAYLRRYPEGPYGREAREITGAP